MPDRPGTLLCPAPLRTAAWGFHRTGLVAERRGCEAATRLGAAGVCWVRLHGGPDRVGQSELACANAQQFDESGG